MRCGIGMATILGNPIRQVRHDNVVIRDNLVIRGSHPAMPEFPQHLTPRCTMHELCLDPEAYPRRILLALGGMSPQVVTETLYALCEKRNPPFVPTEVHLLTTTLGHERALDGLLDEDGAFHDFIRDYGLENRIAFTSKHLHLLRAADGEPLADVRSEEDNIAAADAITEYLRQLTADAQCAVHVSIAGGRNTLGFYLGYALSMFGRPQDRLSHVLVPPQFEGIEQFYYPPPKPEKIVTRDRRTTCTREAVVTLAEIPFVSLRHGLPQALIDGRASYSQTVAAIRRALAPPSLRIDRVARRIWCGEHPVDLPPQLFAFYAWMALRRRRDDEHGGHVNWWDAGIAREFLDVYRSVVGEMAYDYEESVKVLRDGMPKEFFAEKKTRINKWLREELGAMATPYLIGSSGKRPKTRFGLSLQVQSIVLV